MAITYNTNGAFIWIEATVDSAIQYKVSLVANNAMVSNVNTTKFLPASAVDQNLANNGWTRRAIINGGFFWQNTSSPYDRTEANGTEVAFGNLHEVGFDNQYNSILNIGNYDSAASDLFVDTKGSMETYASGMYWQVTGGAGIVWNGTKISNPPPAISSAATTTNNRTFIGKKANGTVIMGAVRSGYTRTWLEIQTFLVDTVGMYSGVTLDGGGSTFFAYDTNGTGDFSDKSTRWDGRTVKNAIVLYEKSTGSTPPPDPDPNPQPGTEPFVGTTGAGIPPFALAKTPKRRKLYVKQNDVLVEIKQTNVKDSELVSIIKDWVEKE